MANETLPASFYARRTADVAVDLLGRRLVCATDGGEFRAGTIVETEAYVGPEDQASHAFRGRTQRTEVMFGPPGIAYVYLIYGLHHCFNAVTEPEGYPAAVLVRAVEPETHVSGRTNGPGLLCRALGIDRSHNGEDLTGRRIFIEAGERSGECTHPLRAVRSGPRIGVPYAGEWATRSLRFWLDDSVWVSRK